LIFRTLRNTARAYKNAVAREVVEVESRDGETDFSDIQHLVAGTRGREKALDGGDVEGGIWTAGVVMGLIDDIPSCEELIQRIVAEAREAARVRMAALLEA